MEILSGAAGALATAVIIPEIAAALESMNLSPTAKKGLLLLASGVIGSVANSEAGGINTIGQTVNNYLDHLEYQQRINARREIEELQAKLNSPQCSDNSCVADIQKLTFIWEQVRALDKLDTERDEKIYTACSNGHTHGL